MYKTFFKNLWLWLLVALILGFCLFWLRVNLPGSVNGGAQLVVSFKDGETRKFEGEVPANMTILEAVYSSSLGGGFGLRYSIQKDGSVDLASIGNMINTANKSWNFYLNKNLVKSSDINRVEIKRGDLIEIKYE